MNIAFDLTLKITFKNCTTEKNIFMQRIIDAVKINIKLQNSIEK